MEAETITPGRGSEESAAWFRARLDELGVGQSEMARLLLRMGDDRKFETIARGMRRMVTGEARVAGEMRGMMMYLIADKADRKRRMEDLEIQLDALRSGRHQMSKNGVDITAEAASEVERRLVELRDMPLLVLSGAFADIGRQS